MHLSLASILRESAIRFGDDVAAADGERTATFGGLWEEALACAGRLRELGVQRDDRVALLAPNSLEFVIAYFGILARGAVVVPLPPMLVRDEIEQLLADSGARVVLADPELVALAQGAATSAGVPVVALDASLGSDVPEPGPALRHPLDPAVVFYTSGTTGRPKGAVLTHLNLVMNCFINTFTANPLTRDDAVLACLPLFHTFGQTAAMNGALLVGGRLVLQRKFDAEEALDLMERHRVSVLLGVPTMLVALPPAVLERFESLFDTTVHEGYGLSETSPTATVSQAAFGRRAGAVGHPIWGVEVEIAEAEREQSIELLGPDEVGEIVIRGHNLFAGYHEQPEATAAVLVDGWLRTGDLGRRDDDGFVHIVDRKKDMILRGGYNVYPREVEDVLVRHPSVREAAVIGVPHDVLGEEVLAVLVLANTAAPPSEDELLAWTSERVAAHKRPRLIRIVDELPLGPSRKVLKRTLRERFAGAASAEPA
jgi:long-chain acyl-CoA synthetase